MKPESILLGLFAIVQVWACTANENNSGDGRKEAIEEIKEAEKNFAKMAAEKGVAEAFYFYADSNAVIKRQNDSLIYGRDAIKNYYSDPSYLKASVSWSPDFVDASEQGDFGYTYGKYNWEFTDSINNRSRYNGVFQTVWKKQADGSWKYVWD